LRICKVCFKNFEGNKKSKGICSEVCRIKIVSETKCYPSCSEENLSVIQVTFKNGSKHLKRYCKLCRSGGLVRRVNCSFKNGGYEFRREKTFKNPSKIRIKKVICYKDNRPNKIINTFLDYFTKIQTIEEEFVQ